MVERSFFNLVYLNFLNIRFSSATSYMPPTENDTVSFREPASFLRKFFFQEYFQEHGGFLETLKQVFRIYFSEFSFPTYLPLTINY